MILRQRVAAWGLTFRQCGAANLAQPRKHFLQLRVVYVRPQLHDTGSFFRLFTFAGWQRRDGTHVSGLPPQQLSVR